MIHKWSKQIISKDLEFVRKGENLFVDDRGVISNHELTEPINLIGMIDSKRYAQSQSLSSTTRAKMSFYERSNN